MLVNICQGLHSDMPGHTLLADQGLATFFFRTPSRASIRSPEQPQRKGGHDGSWDSRREDRGDRSRSTAQKQHSSSSRPSKAASGSAAHSPMRSSGAHHKLPAPHLSFVPSAEAVKVA